MKEEKVIFLNEQSNSSSLISFFSPFIFTTWPFLISTVQSENGTYHTFLTESFVNYEHAKNIPGKTFGEII